ARARASSRSRSRAARRSRWPAAAIRWPRSRSTASRTASRTSPPAVARSSSSSKARRCPRSPCSSSAPVVERAAPLLRRTKIVASLGTVEDRRRRLAAVRAAAREADRCIGVLLDLSGPKIRIECFRDGRVQLSEGAPFTLDTTFDPKVGTAEVVGVAYKNLPQDVAAGDTLLLNDGQIVLDVERVTPTAIDTRVRVGGELSDRKGLNRQGGGISAPALAERDREDIRFAAAEGIDFVAVSFARDAADIEEARTLL